MKTTIDENSRPIAKSPLDVLRDTFKTRRERNASYSLHSFSKDLGISRSLLSRVLSGDRPVSLKLALQIATALDMSEQQSKSLLLTVVQSSSKDSKISKKMRAQLEQDLQKTPQDDSLVFTTVEIERFKAMASWYHLALLNLTRLNTFQNDVVWISKQLGITTVETKEAIERLIGLGLLQEHQGKLERSNQSMLIKTHQSEFAIRTFHEQMITKAKDELKNTSQEHFQNRMINGITFTCSFEQVEVIKEKIEKFQDEILALATVGATDKLCQMNIQYFPLNKEQV